MYQNIETEVRQLPKLGQLEWSCNCKGLKKDNYVTMHRTSIDGENKCILCGHYAYRIEKHVLDAPRTWLHKRSR